MRIISSQSLFSVRCPPHCHFDGRQRSGEISGLNGTSASPPTVISTETEQSGVEWRNLQHQWYQCLPLPLSFRPKRSKAEWSGEISDHNGTSASPSHLSFRPERSKAEWSGVEKSPAPMAQAPLRWEISGLRASMEFKYLDLPADTQPRSR